MSSLRAVNGQGGATGRADRCVVLAEPGGAAPTLLTGLARRGMAASVVCDAPSVMVELAHAPAAALILTMAPTSAAAADLLQAVRTYYPRTVCWTYRREPGDSLGRLIKLDASAPVAAPPASPAASDDPASRDDDTAERVAASGADPIDEPGRVSQDHAQGPDAPEAPEAPEAPDRSAHVNGGARTRSRPQSEPLVSQEEMAMLLGPEEDDLQQAWGS